MLRVALFFSFVFIISNPSWALTINEREEILIQEIHDSCVEDYISQYGLYDSSLKSTLKIGLLNFTNGKDLIFSLAQKNNLIACASKYFKIGERAIVYVVFGSRSDLISFKKELNRKIK